MDECSTERHNCDLLASCFDNTESFFCVCNPGYAGDGVTCSGKKSYCLSYNSAIECREEAYLMPFMATIRKGLYVASIQTEIHFIFPFV